MQRQLLIWLIGLSLILWLAESFGVLAWWGLVLVLGASFVDPMIENKLKALVENVDDGLEAVEKQLSPFKAFVKNLIMKFYK